MGNHIQKWRLRRGLSTTEVGKRAGIAPSSLQSIEAGETDPTVSTLSAIAEALGVPAPWLLSDPEQFEFLMLDEPDEETELANSVDPVTDAILRAKQNERELFAMLAALIAHGDPKLLRPVETNLRSLIKETRRPPIPWAARRPGNFEPPND
jgi:transcriptional regulator with XRE-family HTH domain